MKLVCINDSNKPDKIPLEDWPKKNSFYTPIKIVRMGIQKDKYGVLLKEINLKPSAFTYEYYDLARFSPHDEEDNILKELEELELTI